MTGAYIKERRVHTVHKFFAVVLPGHKIIEVSFHVVYLSIAVETIKHLQIRLVDQDGDSVNFHSEVITVQLHVKSLSSS